MLICDDAPLKNYGFTVLGKCILVYNGVNWSCPDHKNMNQDLENI